MSRNSEKYVLVNKEKLMNLIYKNECAIRDYSYARGVRAGLNHSAKFERPAEMCIYARNADTAEAELYDYVLFSDKQ